jgi:hypothetical protein
MDVKHGLVCERKNSRQRVFQNRVVRNIQTQNGHGHKEELEKTAY